MKKYSENLKEKVIEKCLKEGRSQALVEREYGLGRGTASYWIKMYSKECQTNTVKTQEKEKFSEYLKIKKENEELKKENLFLKKAAAFFAKEI